MKLTGLTGAGRLLVDWHWTVLVGRYLISGSMYVRTALSMQIDADAGQKQKQNHSRMLCFDAALAGLQKTAGACLVALSAQ